jgi:hypothetical protein
MALGLENPSDALAGATPYLRMFSLVSAGWLMARQALAAHETLGRAPDDEIAEAKLATARFFCEQMLPAVHGLAPAVTAGAEPLFAVDPSALRG